jgi:hypothetical protein
MNTLATTGTTVNRSSRIATAAALVGVTVALGVAFALILTPKPAIVQAARPVPVVHTPAVQHQPITIAAVGDSITAWSGYDPVKNSLGCGPESRTCRCRPLRRLGG